MKIFDWVQSKLTGKPSMNKPSSKVFDDEKVQKSTKEEMNEWPHGLLAIGTLGNSTTDLEEDHLQSNPPPSPKDHPLDFTPEEATQIHNELNSYLSVQADQSNSSAEFEKVPNFLALDKFLQRQSSFKGERTVTQNADCEESKESFSRFQGSTSVVLSRGIDICVENTNTAIGKKSLSFLLKKMFVCRSGFAPAAAPGIREPVPLSRMEKIMKAILHKKIYPQSSSPSTLSRKKHLESGHNLLNSSNQDEEANIDKDDEGSKWVKTDSEYIVLEI